MKRLWVALLAVLMFLPGCAWMREHGFTMEEGKTVCDYIQKKRILVLASSNAVGGYTQYFDQAVTQVSDSLKECEAVPVMGPAGWNPKQMQSTLATLKKDGIAFDLVMVVGVNQHYSQPTSFGHKYPRQEQVWRTYADVRLMDLQNAVIESGDAEKDFRYYDNESWGNDDGFWPTVKKIILFGYFNFSVSVINRDPIKSMKYAVRDAIDAVVNARLNEAFLPPPLQENPVEIKPAPATKEPRSQTDTPPRLPRWTATYKAT